MKSIPARTGIKIQVCRRLTGFLVLLLVSGCGLTMDNEDRLARGEHALAEGDFRAAIIDAKDVLLDEPDNLRGRLLLGRASVEVNDGAAAEKELRRAMQLGTAPLDVAAEFARALLLQDKFEDVLTEVQLEGLPTGDSEIVVRRVYGDAYMGLNQPDRAREMYESILPMQPENLDARLGIASSYISEGNTIQARGMIELILETNADDPRVWLFSGSFNARMQDYRTAAENFQVALQRAEALGDTASRLQAIAGLADGYLEQQEFDLARENIDILVAEAPQSLQTMLLVARLAYVDQDWATAQQNLQQILQVAPKYRPAQMLLGAVHLRSGNLAQAEMYLSSAVAQVPNDVRARQMLAETRLQMRKSDEAQEALAPIVTGPNADSLSLQMAARASLGSRDIDEALQYLHRSIAQDPANVDLQFQLATTLLELGRTEDAQTVIDSINVTGSDEHAYRRDALEVLNALRKGQASVALQSAERVANDYPDNAGAFNLLGALQLATRNLDGAKSSFEQALKLNPSSIISRRYLAAIDESNGDLDAAVSQYNTILAEAPDASWATFALGRIAFSQKDYQKAEGDFLRASTSNPKSVEFRLNLAKAKRQLGKGSDAIKVLEANLDATMIHVPSAVLLGVLKAEAGDFSGAMKIADALLDRNPKDPASHAFKGEIHAFEGNLIAADAEYNKALSLEPTRNNALRAYQIKRQLGAGGSQQPLVDYMNARPLDNEVRAILAESYMQTNDLGNSISNYERVISDQPENAVALNNLAWAYYLVDDPRAVATARKAHEAMPDNGAILDTLGWIIVQKESAEEGEALLRQAVEMENGRSEIRYHHAVALAKLGKIAEAKSALRQILESDQKFASRADAEKLVTEL